MARALGLAAMIKAFTPENLRWLCRDCHRRKTRQDRLLAKFLAACSLEWYGTRRLLRQNRSWALSFSAALQPRSGACGAETHLWAQAFSLSLKAQSSG